MDEIDKRYFVTSPNTSPSMFFGSTASLVFFRPDRPFHSRRAQGAVKAGRVLRGHRKAWALIGPSTAACSIGSGVQGPATGNTRRSQLLSSCAGDLVAKRGASAESAAGPPYSSLAGLRRPRALSFGGRGHQASTKCS